MIQFYMAFIVLMICALPIAYRLFNRFKDGGIMIAASLGLYISGYVMWFFSSIHLFKFTTLSCFICLILTAGVLYAPVFYEIYTKKVNGFIDYLKHHRNAMLISIGAFAVLFFVLNWIFAHRIPSTDTERMMDLGFMMSMYKTDFMPPLDMWAGGEYINYYYFGQYIITYMTKIACIPVEYGYTFGLFFIAAWATVAVYVLVRDITESKLASLLSAFVVVFAGNLHYVVFAKIVPMLWDILQLEGEKPSYWFADSTRYIGYVPEVTTDRTIHEFPSYSFIVGDLHAHVVNILVVIVILCLLWAYLKDIKQRFSGEVNLLKECCNPYFILIGFLLGISAMSNYWDFPIYYIVSGSIILFGMMSAIGLKKRLWGYVTLSGIFIMLIKVAVSLIFNLKFNKMVEGIGIVEKRSLFHQLVLLWGLPVLMSVLFVVLLIRKKKLDSCRLYTLMLCLCATGLIVIPELIFVKDIYINSYPRANTMFKLGYEAFIMFGICSGIIINTFFKEAGKEEGYKAYLYRRTAVILLVFELMTLGFPVTATKSWINSLKKEDYGGFDAAKTIREVNAVDMPAIEALVNIVEHSDKKQPIVLEADGDSYTNTCRVSVLTGYPTILGWHTHEWLWHDSHSYMEMRRLDVESIYTSEDENNTRNILKKYGVDYLFIGAKEYERFEVVQNGILESLGEVVYCASNEDGQLVEIIKINK